MIVCPTILTHLAFEDKPQALDNMLAMYEPIFVRKIPQVICNIEILCYQLNSISPYNSDYVGLQASNPSHMGL